MFNKTMFSMLLLASVSATAQMIDNDGYYKVEHVYSWSNGEAHIWLESNGGEHQCSDKTYPTRYLMSRNTALEFDHKFSIFLAAKTSGQPVKLRYECDSSNIPFVKAVRF
ncbi:hypothetical protein [Photobacterium rosenbergii]|uniref:Uncharacterized protein n=1 Tax=Photobacterium rosenbergii TaxID=294936 RepID=A0ABU3ZE15_9GAMM|nr:hypothetical protein [Photobacterium rosenbergii]MDV5168336.1 hypothetical protein [Photobacterium rosenbergii]